MLSFLLFTSCEYNADVPKYSNSLFSPLRNVLGFRFAFSFFVLFFGFLLLLLLWFGFFCLFLTITLLARQAFDTQEIILFHLSDYVALKCFKTELTPTFCKLFDKEKHYL